MKPVLTFYTAVLRTLFRLYSQCKCFSDTRLLIRKIRFNMSVNSTNHEGVSVLQLKGLLGCQTASLPFLY